MSFLNPALFAILIPLAVLPLMLHLLNKGFPRHFKFPAIKLIRETMARRSKLHRWRHWVLLLLRTIFLLLLLLAFLQPMLRRFGSNPADRNGRQVLIVFDHSVSMEHKGDGPTSRERAIHEAAKLIDSLGADDTVNILVMEPNPTTCFVSFSKDTAEAKRFLNQLKPGFGRADVNLASSVAARLLSQPDARPEIYYLSDFERKKWANASFTALPPAVKLFFVDVGPAHRDNRAIRNARPSQTRMLAGDTVPLEITVGNYSAEPFNDHVTVTLDQRFSFAQEISIAPWSEEKISVPVPVGGPGVHLCEVILPPDALEYDNHFALTLAVQKKEEVLIVTDGADARKSGAYYLETALNPFENEAGSLLPRIISSEELSPARLAGVQKCSSPRSIT
ncbi:MAG: BatA domain-containing protein [Limisphaerales bacterium]